MTHTPLREEFYQKMTRLVLDYDFYEFDPNAKDFERDLMEAYDQSLKAFADEVEREVIGANDTYQKASTEDLVNPFHLYQGKNKLRREQRSALKALLEKWGIK